MTFNWKLVTVQLFLEKLEIKYGTSIFYYFYHPLKVHDYHIYSHTVGTFSPKNLSSKTGVHNISRKIDFLSRIEATHFYSTKLYIKH